MFSQPLSKDQRKQIQVTTDEQHRAAIKIQSLYRGHLVRRFALYLTIFELHPYYLTDYKAVPAGNDPEFEFDSRHQTAGRKSAIIGTGCLRIFEIASKLHTPGDPLPTMILIDNSSDVADYWNEIKGLVLASRNYDLFLNAYYKIVNTQEFRTSAYYLNRVVELKGFHFLKQLMISTVCIKQSWATPGLLNDLRIALSFQGIKNLYAYPSNIVAWSLFARNDVDAVNVLDNIKEMKPTLAIHTDLCATNLREKDGQLTFDGVHAESAHYITNHDPAHVLEAISSKSDIIDDLLYEIGEAKPYCALARLSLFAVAGADFNADNEENIALAAVPNNASVSHNK